MKGIKLVGALLAALVILGSSIALADQEEVEAQSAGSLSPGAEGLVDRTAKSETFSLSNGQVEARIYPEPVNYRDEEGNWQPIGERLRETSEQTLTNGPNNFDVTLPKQIDSKPIRFEVGDQWVESQLLRKDLEGAQIDGGIASYEGEGNAPSFEFTGLSNGLKEEIELTGPGQANRFTYELSASDGLIPSLADDGSVRFFDSDGSALVVLPAPVMSDSAPGPAVSRKVHYELSPEEDGHWKLSVVADREWLEDPDRVWPARIDPTMTVGPALECVIGGMKGETGWIDCSSWGRKDLLVGYVPQLESKYDGWYRTLMELQTTSIPVNSEITSATFNIRSLETAKNTKGVELRKVTKPWNWEAAWSRYDGTHLWTTEGGDYSESLGEVLTATRGNQIGWWQFNMPAKVVETEVNAKKWLSLIMKLIDDKVRECGISSCTERKIDFDSSSATTVANRPYFSVVYTAPAPIVTTEAPTSVGETGATLKGQVNPHGYATTYQFEYGLTTAYGTKVPTTAESVGSGKANVAVSKAISGLKGNTTYHYRVSATNAYGTTPGLDKTFTTPRLPTATTEAASGVKEKEATLKGSVNPNGNSTTYQFEYGPTTSYGTRVPLSPESAGSGTTAVAVSKAISGLTQGATYHYRVVASNAAGTVNGLDKTLKTTNPPQTTITSPTPTYTSHEEPPIKFESSQSGSTFKCGLDEGETPTKSCTSSYAISEHLSEGWHTFRVLATNAEGIKDPTPATWTFNTAIYPAAPATSKMTSPEEGAQSSSYYTLSADWAAPPNPGGAGIAAVTFQFKTDRLDSFETIPAEYVKDAQGTQIKWPLIAKNNPGHSEAVYFDAGHFKYQVPGHPEWGNFELGGGAIEREKVQFRAVFDGAVESAGASAAVTTEFSQVLGSAHDAVEAVGPGSLDLLTGTYTISRTDVSIPVPGSESNLEFTRVYESTYRGQQVATKTLGGDWQPSAPVERLAPEEAWVELRERHQDRVPPQFDKECWDENGETTECGTGCPPDSCEEWMVEAEIPEANWVEIIDNDGAALSFEISGSNYVAPEYAKEYVLTKPGESFALTNPEGARTTFAKNSVGIVGSYRPTTVSWQATEKSARMVYENTGNALQLSMMIAPSMPNITCDESPESTNYAPTTPGCRSLTFQYGPGTWFGQRLLSISYHGSSGNYSKVVAEYKYDPKGALIEEWDPRLAKPLKETYTYRWDTGLIETLTPPGEYPWQFGFGFGEKKRPLQTVARGGDESTSTSIYYGVPLSGEGSYNLSPTRIAEWGQMDYPVDATEISVLGGQSVIKYMDPDGHVVNTASPKVLGASGPSIETTETDGRGNVVRQLSAQNRLDALGSEDSVARSHELDSHFSFSSDGTEMRQSWGPLHEVRLKNGSSFEARLHTVIEYDKDAPKPEKGKAPPHLPTKETIGAVNPDVEGDYELRVTETKYDWKLLKPTEIVVDPQPTEGPEEEEPHVALRTRIAYDPTTGLPIERSLPAGPNGGDAHTTVTTYYHKSSILFEEPCAKSAWAGLPCEVKPAKQPGTAGQPELLVTKYKTYSSLDEPTEVVESPGGKEVTVRKTIKSYDAVGRETSTAKVGGGTALPPTQTVYDSETGRPVEQKLSCEVKCEGFDSQAVAATYDKLGRLIRYSDADGNVSETTYDLLGRPVKISDGKGTQAFGYDTTSGALTKLEDSAVGTFTAAYNADGAMTERGLPNGLVAKTTYDSTSTPTKLTYTKVTGCSEKCIWLEESEEHSIYGQVLARTSLTSSQQYSYDKAGRLTLVRDTPAGGGCTTRAYAFDADSNRTSLTTSSPGVGGACTESGGTKQGYTYDAADRLTGEGIEYDSFGRITSLPKSYAGGSVLTTSFYSNEMIASQSQGGITNNYQLDALGRVRQRVQTGGSLEGTEVFHYAMASDSTAWTERGSAWTRNIAGIGGELSAIQPSMGEASLQLTDLHGDVVATASLSPTAKESTAKFEFDEFGNPKQGSAGRYGWLGGKQRRTELPSGVIQMGVRSYVPAMGRFISTDPIRGGSANAYDYANANPVTGFDLAGTKPYDSACLSGFAGCKCKMWSKFKRGARGRMILTTVRKCNVVGGITLGGVASGWGKGTGNGFHSIPAPHPVHAQIEPVCRPTDPCQNYQKHVREFHCEPGKEYEFNQTWEFQINLEGLPAHTLGVKIEQFCPK